MSQLTGPVLVLGAGATKACNGPMTNEILFEADRAAQIIERNKYLALIDSFLKDVFRLPPRKLRTKISYPGLPLLMSLLDTAIDRGQPLGLNYDVGKLHCEALFPGSIRKRWTRCSRLSQRRRNHESSR